MFDGSIGLWEIGAWVAGLVLITLIDVIKEKRRQVRRESIPPVGSGAEQGTPGFTSGS
jgi:hypothetical protein